MHLIHRIALQILIVNASVRCSRSSKSLYLIIVIAVVGSNAPVRFQALVPFRSCIEEVGDG